MVERSSRHLCVRQDIDAHYAEAQRAGANVAMPIHDTEYGSREYTARDSDGHLWAFGTYEMGRGKGPPTIFPEVHYRDPHAALTFLTSAFGFTKPSRSRRRMVASSTRSCGSVTAR